MSIKILIADDHRIMRSGIRSLLDKEADMEVVGEAENGRMTVRLAQKLSPDVVIMDIAMPDLNGIDASRQILSEDPNIKVVALSMHSNEQFVAGMLNAGASGYLVKDCNLQELCLAIRSVVANRSYLSPGVANIVLETYRREVSRAERPEFDLLTSREREVLQLVAEGKISRKIASHLHVSMKTVDAHRHQIMHKLDIHSVAGLTKYAILKGIMSLEA
ncbi:MAG: response regulator transcription factor [Deltaproteobacteria bacterium]|nr:response regulator transcription factor [Deltaproteobacteria bacterium]